jgi:membrane protein
MNKVKKHLSDFWQIFKKTFAAWNEADPFRQSAIVAYYAVFSIPALLVIVIACAGFAFGEEAVRGEVSSQMSSILGKESAEQVEGMIAKAGENKGSGLATIISAITLILGSTGVFGQLQVSLNQIWEVKVVAKKKWLKTVKDRLFSFGLVVSIAFLLLISLLLTAVLSFMGEWIQRHLPDFMLFLFETLNFVIPFIIVTVLFALMFKILPDARIQMKDVWVGALITALLFTIGKSLLGIYFGKAQPGSTYGAAGSVILIMLWVSYSCMIVFFGAEFTKQYTMHYGHEIRPSKDAIRIELTEEEKLVTEKKLAVEQVEKEEVKKT